MNFAVSMNDLLSIGPEMILVFAAMVVLVFDLFGTSGSKRSIAWFSVFAIVASGINLWNTRGMEVSSFWGMYEVDTWSVLFKLVFLVVTGFSILISVRYLEQQKMNYGEYYAILLIATVGMMFMVSTTQLVMLLIGLEILSISTYILCAMQRNSEESPESGVKYLLLGAFATAFLLYGMALMYGSTGSLDLAVIGERISAGQHNETMTMFGMLLMIIGFGFKIGAAPFHMWAPDVYQGAPTPVTGFMSAGPKAAGFAALTKVLVTSFAGLSAEWTGLIWVLAVLTMTIGNVMALSQENVKRMLAYSSISHAGYLMVALVAMKSGGMSAMFFYLLAYAVMSLGAFGVIVIMSSEKERLTFSDFSGLGFKYPYYAAALFAFMLSMAGIPLTAGFAGKFQIFKSALSGDYTWLVIIGLLNSVISVFYYLKIAVYMYMKEPAEADKNLTKPEGRALAVQLGILLALVGIFVMGIFPEWFYQLADMAQLPLVAMK